MRVVSIVQARMGSTRFPGKTLEPLGDATLLDAVLSRIARSSRVDEIVVATTLEPEDDAVAAQASEAGYAVVRGSTDDVLDRYATAAQAHDADVVVRNTADEPFVDPALIDECVDVFTRSGADYVSNNLQPVYPEGLDTEVFSREALETARREATRPSDREHVTPFLWRQPDRFRLQPAGGSPVRPDLRLTVDYPADLEFARALYAELPHDFLLADIVALVERRPDLLALAPRVPRREGYLKSVGEE